MFCKGAPGAAPCSGPPAEGQARQDLPYAAGRLALMDGTVSANLGKGLAVIEGAANVAGFEVADNRGIGVWSAGAFADLASNRVVGTAWGTVSGREGEIETADGVVVQGTERWKIYADDSVEVSSNRINGSDRVGLLVVADLHGFGGRLALGEGAIEGNALDAVLLGDLGGLQTEGIALEAKSTDEVAPPSCSPVCSE